MDCTRLTASEIARVTNAREWPADAPAASYRERIRLLDDRIGAFLRLNDQDAAAEPSGLLAGVPVAVKDNICTAWMPTTAASRILENYRPPYNAAVVEKLLAAGAYVMGKSNLDEFAMGSSTEYSAFFPTRNPHDLTRTPGGSSGGSAAAVAAGLVPLALGSDTGGSVRQPAAMCGVVGYKPPYGRVSRYGLIAFAPSFDQIGPLGRTVRDVALLMQVIAGHDPREATSSREQPPDYLAALEEAIPAARVGVITEFFGDGVDADVKKAVESSLRALRDLGHRVDTTSVTTAAWGLPTYFVVGCGETYSNLARYQGTLFGYRAPVFDNVGDMMTRTRESGFGPEVKRRVLAGAYVLSVGYRDRYYAKAQEIRRAMRAQFDECFRDFDFLVSPVSPFTAFPLNTRNLDPQQMYLADIFTSVANLVGCPALSLPCGFDDAGLPVGFQIMSAPEREGRLFALAHRLEEALALSPNAVTPP